MDIRDLKKRDYVESGGPGVGEEQVYRRYQEETLALEHKPRPQRPLTTPAGALAAAVRFIAPKPT